MKPSAMISSSAGANDHLFPVHFEPSSCLSLMISFFHPFPRFSFWFFLNRSLAVCLPWPPRTLPKRIPQPPVTLPLLQVTQVLLQLVTLPLLVIQVLLLLVTRALPLQVIQVLLLMVCMPSGALDFLY